MTTTEITGKLNREEEEEVPTLFHPPKRLPTAQKQKVLLTSITISYMPSHLQMIMVGEGGAGVG